jgi:transcription factor IIIB subunit 2
MVKKNPKYSKRINYDALAGLLTTPLGQSPTPSDRRGRSRDVGEKDMDGLLRFDDKDEDGMDVVEEDARDSGAHAPTLKKRATTEAKEDLNQDLGLEDGDEEEEEYMDEGKDEFPTDGGWEDAFEQEA